MDPSCASSITSYPHSFFDNPSEIEDTSFLVKSLSITFDPGRERLYARFFQDKISRNDLIGGAYQLKINGDGACWSRALWQDVFNQILDNPASFETFILQVCRSRFLEDIRHPNVPTDLVQKTIYILHELKDLKTEEKRIKYLDYDEVDKVLIFFMRYVAAAQIEKEQKECGRYQSIDDNILKEIRYQQNAYARGAEIIAFGNYFNLKTCVVRENGLNELCYFEKPANKPEILIGRVKELKNTTRLVARYPVTQIISGPEDGHLDVLVILPRPTYN